MKQNKKKHNALTEELIKGIIELDVRGLPQYKIGNKLNIGHNIVCSALHYYRGKDTAIAKKLGAVNKALIDEFKQNEIVLCDKNKDPEVVWYPNYELKLLFGLIKLTFKPLKK